jgi:hypothetical protein
MALRARWAAAIISLQSATVRAIGFLAKDVLARLQRRNRRHLVQVVGQDDRNRIEVGLRQHLFHVGVVAAVRPSS